MDGGEYEIGIVFQIGIDIIHFLVGISCVQPSFHYVLVHRSMLLDFIDDMLEAVCVDHSYQRFVEVFDFEGVCGRFDYGFADTSQFLQVELDVLEGCSDLDEKGLGAFIDLKILNFVFAELLEGVFDGCSYDGLEFFDGFGHAEGDHGAEGLFQDVLFFEEIDAAEDEAEFKWKFFLASRVERRQEHVGEDQFFDIIHKNVEIVEMGYNVWICIYQLFDLVYP